jgi:large subunit ribosomal protein L29
MKNSEIRSLSTEEVKQKIAETVELVEKLKFANAVSPIDNPMKIRNIKKDIARLSTELSNR